MNYFTNIFKSRFILTSLVKQDLKNRYRNSIVGVGWTLITPLGLVLIIGVIYSQVLGQPIKGFMPFLFSGLIPWFYFVQCADGGTVSFLSAEGYIKQTQTPIEIFPIRVAMVAFVNLFFSLFAYILMCGFLKPEAFNLNMLSVLLSLIIWLIFGIGIATLSGLINTYIRDFSPLQSLVLQGLFYATPIMYPVDFLKNSDFKWVYVWNPLYYFVEITRKPLLGEIIEPKFWIITIGLSFALFIIAIILIQKIGRKITFRL